jgi:hypothetical protein
MYVYCTYITYIYCTVPLCPQVVQSYSMYDEAVNPLTPTKCTV